ncbi:enoyl-CoA hydratase-related protein [Algiphilus sp.]|uniref:enoyl-CoA hydratase/isomerase family protein n=1 Tax=Algiphilus sp. TaxID=1872431 RepID=UPI002A5E3137|nr:enoyl-CoA hydratase-related protein [Pseudomonadota bacterium]
MSEVSLPECETLQCSFADGVLHVTLNRPDARNAMNRAMVEELGTIFDTIAMREAVRVVVLRGAGGHFCAGADLKEVMAGGTQAPAPGQDDPIKQFSRGFGSLLRKVAHAPQVVIAVIEGSVLGGGFGLACVSDIALAHIDARFGLPETTRGLPPAQIAPFVVERIGLTQARRLCLTGARFDGRRAEALGLVHESFADDFQLNDKLDRILEDVRQCAPQANAMTKDIVLSVGHMDMDQVLDMAAEKFAQAVRGPEASEGISAFLQKRTAKWASRN